MFYDIFLFIALLLLAFLSYRHHSAAIILLTSFLPTYLLRLNIAGLPTTFLELAIITTTAAGLLQPTVRRSWRSAWRRLPVTLIILVLLFVLASIISTAISPHPRTSLGILKGWIFFPLLLGWLVAVITPHKTGQIIRALIVSGTIMALIGLTWLNGLNRIKGVYDTPNSLALYLTPIFIMALWQSVRVFKTHRRAEKITFLLASLIIGLALIATQSAAGIIAVTISLLVGAFYWANPLSKKRWLITAVLFFIIAAGYLFYTGRLAYLTSPLQSDGQPNSISVRVQLWTLSLELIKKHPWLGVGLGTFEPAYQQALHERFRQFENCKLKIENCIQPLAEYVYRDPHNWLLSFWLNTGLLGLLSFVGLHAFVARKVVPRYGLLAANYKLPAPALALLALLLFGLTDTIYWKNDLAALHWIIILLITQKHEKKSLPTQREPQKATSR